MILRVVTMSLIAIALTLLVSGTPRTEPAPEFRFAFKALANQIPDVVGTPLENERYDPVDGMLLQQTTTGVMTLRRADNQTSFTDGVRTWVDGPSGILVQEIQDQDSQVQVEAQVEAQVSQQAPPAPPLGPLPLEAADPPAAPSQVESAPAPQPAPTTSRAVAAGGSVLSNNLIVSWYGNPNTGLMGVLGQYEGADLAARLRRQANAYAPLTDKNILPAYELIAVVAQGSPGADGRWRRRETQEIMDLVLQEARANGFVVIMDVQVGFSNVQDELEWLRPYLEQPDVYLALDPEFDMWKGQIMGEYIGHTMAAEVNYAIGFLESIIQAKNLPPKVLIVHQFTQNMLPDKENIVGSSLVDVVLDMDGFGNQSLKMGTWNMVMKQPLQFAGIKLFYDQDPGMFTPAEVMELTPTPAVVIYQ